MSARARVWVYIRVSVSPCSPSSQSIGPISATFWTMVQRQLKSTGNVNWHCQKYRKIQKNRTKCNLIAGSNVIIRKYFRPANTHWYHYMAIGLKVEGCVWRKYEKRKELSQKQNISFRFNIACRSWTQHCLTIISSVTLNQNCVITTTNLEYLAWL